MTVSINDQSQDRLSLHNRLSEIAQVVAWTDGLASRYAIPTKIQLAMHACLEEVLTNVIRHGYGTEGDHGLVVYFTMPRDGFFVFVVDDEAPRFNPLDAPDLPALDPQGVMRVGGQGIRILRRFADTLEYEATPNGNRLRIGFSASGSAVRTD